MIYYNIVEIFESLQGEGFNTGLPCIFIRFGKCNLRCAWCDTNYHKFTRISLDDVLNTVEQYHSKNIIITGGEPTIQPHLEALLSQLKEKGYYLAIETNGLSPVSPLIDYIATSPKKCHQDKYHKFCLPKADEVRIVTDGSVIQFCEIIEAEIMASRYYLSPCEENGRLNIVETITQLSLLNQRKNKTPWLLSLQTHKLAGIE